MLKEYILGHWDFEFRALLGILPYFIALPDRPFIQHIHCKYIWKLQIPSDLSLVTFAVVFPDLLNAATYGDLIRLIKIVFKYLFCKFMCMLFSKSFEALIY